MANSVKSIRTRSEKSRKARVAFKRALEKKRQDAVAAQDKADADAILIPRNQSR